MTGTAADPRPPKPRPAPISEPDSAPYLQAAKEGRLVVQRCDSCGHHQLYGRALCASCGGDVTWIDASGYGTVYSWTVIRQNHSRPWRDMIPYVVALVDLDEGPRVMTNIVGCDPESVSIGMKVVARFENVGADAEAAVALFEPA
ncbi:MAG: Zn-ribbon domain-containing OB-fold protein [Acidimicrobiales bacterium]